MYKTHKPSASLLEVMKKYNIAADEILTVTCTDLSLDCNFVFSWLVLTKKRVYFLFSNSQINDIDHLAGHDGRNDLPSDVRVEYYGLDEIDLVEISHIAAGGIISVVIDGKAKKICAASATCLNGAFTFSQCVSLAKKGEFEQINELFSKGKKAKEVCKKCGTPFKDYGNRICPKCHGKMPSLIRLFKYFLPYKAAVFTVLLCVGLTSLLSLVSPYLSGKVLYGRILENKLGVTELFGEGFKVATALLIIAVTIFLTKVVGQALSAIQNISVAKIVPYVVNEIKTGIFNVMSKLSIGFFQKRETGGLMTRVLDDAEQVTNVFIEDVPRLMVDCITIIGVAAAVFVISWPVAIAALLFIPLSSLITIRVLPKLHVFFNKRFTASRNMNSHINDNLTGARVVRAFGQQNSETERFQALNENVKEAEYNIVSVQNELYAAYHLVEKIGVFAVWGLGSFMIMKSFDFNYADIITLIGYIGMLNGPVNNISKALRQCANCLNSSQRIFEILDSTPDVIEAENPISAENIKGSIKVENVTFGYDKDKPVLNNLSFEIEAGKMLGVVGRSGAGKTTLLCLLSRLYDTDEGNIFIDGVNIRDYNLRELHRKVAVVSQETHIFMGTVAENIAYSNPDIPRDKIIDAAMAASAHDFIVKLPDGYDTVIGSAGRELSGGERQRISIARAILSDPKILILDEATASMDTETEQSIQQSLERLAKGRTTISVAHRLSTLRNADKLIVIENGFLEEYGTHEELLAKKGIYHHLAELQGKALTIKGDEAKWSRENFSPRGPHPMGPPMGRRQGPPPMPQGQGPRGPMPRGPMM